MPAPSKPQLEPGKVYRTKELARWGTNPARLAKRLVALGELKPLAHGLLVHPRRGRFGEVPPSDDEVIRAFLEGAPYISTGPDRWNTLGLGSTALYATPLIYNTKRSGLFILGGKSYRLRRVKFPEQPTPEWYVVDLIEHAGEAGLPTSEIERYLLPALVQKRFDLKRLRLSASEYGTRRTQDLVRRVIERAEATL